MDNSSSKQSSQYNSTITSDDDANCSKVCNDKMYKVLFQYASDIFINWNDTKDNYYVQAPIDRLGLFAYHLRTHIISLILAGNPAIKYLQSFHNQQLTTLATLFNYVGLEIFFFTLIVSELWLFDAKLGILLAILLAFGFFVCGSLKVLLCLPRPSIPPAIELAKENYDWAWPSNHALLGTAFPWFIWIYVSTHYDLYFVQAILLLVTIFIWNSGIIWSRIYLGVHSPCDVVAGWMIGCLLLFIFDGFSDRLYNFYSTNTSAPFYFVIVVFGALYVHPRAWPETQSFGEVIIVLSSTLGMVSSRYFQLGGTNVPRSILETNPVNYRYLDMFARFVIGNIIIVITRIIVKPLTKYSVIFCYEQLRLPFYSYSDYCKSVEQPTKRYTKRLRCRPIAGKIVNSESLPYDIDLPIKFIVYYIVGFLLAEGCPAVFRLIKI